MLRLTIVAFIIVASVLAADFPIRLSSEENFLLIDGVTSQVVLEQGSHINERVTPGSTFKIVLSLVGYDSGILKDKETPTWAFQKGFVDWKDSWKAPQNPTSWIKNSCVWYSQVLVVQLGSEKVRNYLQMLKYGNQDMSGGLTNAWLGSSLKISPKEQVSLIQKMTYGRMPISNDAIQMTKSLLFVDELSGGWKLFGKIGFVDADLHNLETGWFVGWVEKDKSAFIFAYNILDPKLNPAKIRPRVKQLLAEANIMK